MSIFKRLTASKEVKAALGILDECGLIFSSDNFIGSFGPIKNKIESDAMAKRYFHNTKEPLRRVANKVTKPQIKSQDKNNVVILKKRNK